VNDGASQSASLSAVGGVMAGTHRYQLTLGPFPEGSRNVRFSFHCTHPGCDGTDICCKVEERTVSIIEPAAGGEAPEA
jgi:hypothetical protein